METERINDTLIRLTSEKGIVDTRTNQVHNEVICKKKDEHFFKDAE